MSNETTIVFEELLKLDIPEGFRPATQAELERFPQEGKLGSMYIRDEGPSYITLTKTGNELHDEQVEERLKHYCTAYRRMLPGFQLGQMAKKKTDCLTVGTFFCQSTTLDKDLFHAFAVIAIEGSEVVITMSCEVKRAMQQGKLFMDCINSMRCPKGPANERPE